MRDNLSLYSISFVLIYCVVFECCVVFHTYVFVVLYASKADIV